MPNDRDVQVHLLPDFVRADALPGSVAIVIDVLRATTTVVHALAAGCKCVRPCLEVEEARELAAQMRAGRVILGGERNGVAPEGFDVGNSPRDFTAKVCREATVVLTTTVLGEIDRHKSSQNDRGRVKKARAVDQRIKGWRTQGGGSLADPVTVQGAIQVQAEFKRPNFAEAPSWLSQDHPDDQIICAALNIQAARAGDHVVIFGEVLAGGILREGDPTVHLRKNGLSY